jgi:hypothetical protein
MDIFAFQTNRKLKVFDINQADYPLDYRGMLTGTKQYPDVLKAEGYAPLDIDALATEVSARVRGVANKVAVESAKKSRRTIKD